MRVSSGESLGWSRYEFALLCGHRLTGELRVLCRQRQFVDVVRGGLGIWRAVVVDDLLVPIAFLFDELF